MVRRPDGDDDSAEAWQTATAAEAMTAAAVLLVPNAAAMPTATQSAADGRRVGDNNSAVIAMQ
jgi:hypothetical protein